MYLAHSLFIIFISSHQSTTRSLQPAIDYYRRAAKLEPDIEFRAHQHMRQHGQQASSGSQAAPAVRCSWVAAFCCFLNCFSFLGGSRGGTAGARGPAVRLREQRLRTRRGNQPPTHIRAARRNPRQNLQIDHRLRPSEFISVIDKDAPNVH